MLKTRSKWIRWFLIGIAIWGLVWVWQSQKRQQDEHIESPLQFIQGQSHHYSFKISDQVSMNARHNMTSVIEGHMIESVLRTEKKHVQLAVNFIIDKFNAPKMISKEHHSSILDELESFILVEKDFSGSIQKIQLPTSLSQESRQMLKHLIRTFNGVWPSGTVRQWQSLEAGSYGHGLFRYQRDRDKQNIVRRTIQYYVQGTSPQLNRINHDIKIDPASQSLLILKEGLWKEITGARKIELRTQDQGLISTLQFSRKFLKTMAIDSPTQYFELVKKSLYKSKDNRRLVTIPDESVRKQSLRSIKSLTQKLTDNSPSGSSEALSVGIRALRQYPELAQDLAQLIKELAPGDPGYKKKIAVYLGALGHSQQEEAETILLEFLSSSSEFSIHFQTLTALSHLERPSDNTTQALIKFLDDESNEDLRNVAILSLASLSHRQLTHHSLSSSPSGEDGISKIMSIIKSDPQNSYRYLAAMGNGGFKEFIPFIKKALNHDDPTRRKLAVYQLRKIETSESRVLLKDAILQGHDTELRSEAIKTFRFHKPSPEGFQTAKSIFEHSDQIGVKLQALSLVYNKGACCLSQVRDFLEEIQSNQGEPALSVKAQELLLKLDQGP